MRFIIAACVIALFTTTAIAAESKDPCAEKKTNVTARFGEPDEIDNSQSDSSFRVVILNYYALGKQYRFSYSSAAWTPDHTPICSSVEQDITLYSEVGEKIARAALRKKYPKWKEDDPGFKDIPFGMLHDDCLMLAHINKFSVGSSGNYLYFQYPLGDSLVETTLYFDNNSRFYKFEFQESAYSALEFDAKVKADLKFINDVFKKKYGVPAKCSDISFLNVRHGYVSYSCRWKKGKVTAYTGIGSYESKYYAIAAAQDSGMEKKYESFLKKQKDRSAASSADTF